MKGTFVIFVKTGVYVEQILFDNLGIVLVGEGMGRTIITNNKNVVGGSTTFNSATIGKHSPSISLPLSQSGGIVLVGEGLGRTIITNNKNVVGGSTTFNSATIASLPLSASLPFSFSSPVITGKKSMVGKSTTFNSTIIGKQSPSLPLHSSPFPLSLLSLSRKLFSYFALYPSSLPLQLIRANKGMFMALGITVRNTAGRVGQQAMALRSEDISAFFECEFDSNQDTLYPHSGRQYFRDCKVGGTVDFIFGKGAAVFDRPQIRLHKDDPVIITAPQNDPTYPEPKGIIIRNAVINADAGVGKAYLGWPWTNTGKAIFINCFSQGNLTESYRWMTWDTDTLKLQSLMLPPPPTVPPCSPPPPPFPPLALPPCSPSFPPCQEI
ncbi:unnamed protein product [Closterium sp. Naga37s-1]|nr:unnamed protein product [Closterium sp. Naga37s-1]